MIEIEITSHDEVSRALDRLARANFSSLLDAAGDLGERQTRKRIEREKRSPDGVAWAAWSPDYAATRGAGQSLLIDTGDLLRSITWSDSGMVVRRVGTPQDYAEFVHANRPFVGVSDDNLREFADLGERELRDVLEAAWRP